MWRGYQEDEIVWKAVSDLDSCQTVAKADKAATEGYQGDNFVEVRLLPRLIRLLPRVTRLR